MNCIFVCYAYKSNIILLRAMRNREDTQLVMASKSCYTKSNTKGNHPMLQLVDNACFQKGTVYITSEDINLKFVESYNHRVNTAEHGCKAVTYHTIAIL